MGKDTRDGSDRESPLPGTLAFVMTMGSAFLIGWLLMFWLLRERF